MSKASLRAPHAGAPPDGTDEQVWPFARNAATHTHRRRCGFRSGGQVRIAAVCVFPKTLINRYRELQQAFSRRYAKVRIAWSYKTNYLEAICRTFHKGSWAEVVSPFEYEKAIRTGIVPDHIHWNGPYKPDAAIERALSGGAMIHIDNFDELSRIERIAEKWESVPKWSRCV